MEKTELLTIGGDIYNALSKRRFNCKTMLYTQGKWILKIPRKIPIRDGVLRITYYDANSLLEISWHSVFGVWFKNVILDTIDCTSYADLDQLICEVCNKIEHYYFNKKNLW